MTPSRYAATSRLEIPANVKCRTSRTTRIATLSAGIDPLLSQSQRNGPYTQPAELSDIPATPGGIIPEWWARINRNAGRQLIGIGGRHHLGIGGRLAPEFAPVSLTCRGWRISRCGQRLVRQHY